MGDAWFDTHVHLSDPKFDSDRNTVVEKSFQSGIAGFIEIADGPSEWPKAQALAETYPGQIWWAAGLHPYFADQASSSVWKSLEAHAKHPQFVALGEVGLDYAKCPIPREKQIQSFEEALNLARTIDKPLVIHCREAYHDLMPILKNRFSTHSQKAPGVIHCFSGNQKEAEDLIGMGFFLGVDGPLTYPKSDGLRSIFATIPLEHIVLETDSPYLPPQVIRGQRNDPSYLNQVALRLAEIRKISTPDLSKVLRQNSDKLFRLIPSEK